MYNHSTKKQVQYSLTQLSAGLFYHLKHKKFEDITITDICNKGQVTRRTFYRNCETKTDLIIFSTDVLVTELLDSVDFESKDSWALYHDFFAFWNRHREFLSVLNNNSLFDIFLNEFLTVCNAQMVYPLQEQFLSNAADRDFARNYSNAFVIGGLGQMLKLWTVDQFRISAGEIANVIQFLVPSDKKFFWKSSKE